MTTIKIEKYSQLLIFLGILLFFLGLTAGLLIPLMNNPRMGLSAHLEAIMNGLFLVALGLIWNRMVLSERWYRITFLLTVYGTFANFIAVLTAAITGFGKLMPIAGGKEGNAAVENIISVLLVTLSLAMLAVCLIILKGLYNNMNAKNSHE